MAQSPVEEMDLLTGVWTYLVSFPELIENVGSIQPLDPDADPEPFIFQRFLNVQMPNTSESAIVITDAGTWTSANFNNSAFFPRILVEFYVDPIRSTEFDELSEQVVDSLEVYRRGKKLFRIVDSILHRPQHGDIAMGDIRVHNSLRLGGDIRYYPVPAQNGLIRAEMYYAMEYAG